MRRLGESDSLALGNNRASMERGRQIITPAGEALDLTSAPSPKIEVKPNQAAMDAAKRMVQSQMLAAQRETAQSPDLAPHTKTFLATLQTHFAQPTDARPWDTHDERDYGRQVYMLTREQTRSVFMRLRELHKFRPDVFDVKAVVAEVTGIHTDPLPGNVAESRRVVKATGPVTDPSRQIEGAAETPGYLRFRSMLRGKVESDGLKWKKRDTEQ